MARRRMISESLIYDEELNSLSIEAYYIFTRMLAVADDYGVVPGSEYSLRSLLNPHKRVSKKILDYIGEIVKVKLGYYFTYNDKPFFMFKRKSFDEINSYVINKRTKSEYLKIDKKQMDSDNLLEFLGISSESDSSYIESRKKKVESRKTEPEIFGKHPLQIFIDGLMNVSRLEQQPTINDCEKVLAEYDEKLVKEVLEAMENHKPLTKKYKSVIKTLRNWIKIRLEKSNGTGTNKQRRKDYVSPEEIRSELTEAFQKKT